VPGAARCGAVELIGELGDGTRVLGPGFALMGDWGEDGGPGAGSGPPSCPVPQAVGQPASRIPASVSRVARRTTSAV
jgi:hypothetical protein